MDYTKAREMGLEEPLKLTIDLEKVRLKVEEAYKHVIEKIDREQKVEESRKKKESEKPRRLTTRRSSWRLALTSASSRTSV